MKCAKKKRFYIFFPSDLDLWPLGLKFASLVTLVQRYVFTKLEVSIFPISRKSEARDGRTDRQTDRRSATLHRKVA